MAQNSFRKKTSGCKKFFSKVCCRGIKRQPATTNFRKQNLFRARLFFRKPILRQTFFKKLFRFTLFFGTIDSLKKTYSGQYEQHFLCHFPAQKKTFERHTFYAHIILFKNKIITCSNKVTQLKMHKLKE